MISFKTTSTLFRFETSYQVKCLLFSTYFIFNFTHLNAQSGIADSQRLLDSSVTALKNQLNKAIKSSDLEAIVNSHIQLADFYEHLGIDNEAIKHYHNALAQHEKQDTTSVYIGNKISTVHLALKQYANALQYVNKSLETAEDIDYKKGKAVCFALLGSIAEKKHNYPVALEYQKKSSALFEQLSDSTGLAVTCENMGSIYEDLEQFENALHYFLKANDFAENSPSDIKINILNNLGDANRKQGKPNEALPYTLLAYKKAKTAGNTHQEVAALKDLALNYADLNDYTTAFEYMKAHASLSTSETENNNANLVSTLQILYEVEERQAELNLLNKENEINKIRQNIILLSSTFIILLFAGWLLYFRKRKKQESKIQHYKNELLQANLDKKTQEEATLQREIDLKMSSLSNYSLHLAHKNKMISDISRTLTNLKDRNPVMIQSKLESLIKEIDSDLSQGEEWTEFIKLFEQIQPDFFNSLKNSVTTELSPTELRLCMLLRLNLSSKEIASMLRITPDSVRIARYRLRKKLPLSADEDLQVYMLNL